jgi:Flp pilus assembly protein CpaB
MEPAPGLARPSFARRGRRLRRAVLARRRPLAAAAAAFAVLVGLQAAAPASPPTQVAVTAARDLPAGVPVRRDDLTLTRFAPDSVPAGAATSREALVGRTTTGPVRAGEPITDVRVVGGSLLDGYPGRVAAPVRIGDPGAVGLLRIGDLVDVIAADPQGRREAAVVAASAPVVALPRASDTTLASGGLVVLAVPAETARALAAASVSAYLSVVVTR